VQIFQLTEGLLNGNRGATLKSRYSLFNKNTEGYPSTKIMTVTSSLLLQTFEINVLKINVLLSRLTAENSQNRINHSAHHCGQIELVIKKDSV
jgi:hypothetical protein